jgi:hypothetical protein
MTAEAEIDAFMTEVRSLPKFVAVAHDPLWAGHAQGIEDCLRGIYAAGDDDGAAIEFFDEILDLVGNRQIPLKQRLLAFCDKIREWQRCGPARGLNDDHDHRPQH